MGTPKGTNRCCYFLGAATVLLGVIVVVLSVLYTICDRKMDSKSECEEVDIAVVGAGIGGTYMAWKLKLLYPHLTINLYEATDRLGGRIYSVPIPGTNSYKAELGAMRFRGYHTHFIALLNELDLSYSKFTTVGANERIYYLRGQHLTQDNFKSGDVPYSLRDDEQFQYSTQLLYYYNRLIVDAAVPQDHTFDRKTRDGRFLYNLGHKNVLDEVASQEGISFVEDTLGLKYPLGTNENYAWWSPLDQHDYPDADGQYYKVDDGFQAVVDIMADKFTELSSKDRIKTGNKLTTIDSSDPDKTILSFETSTNLVTDKNTKEVCAKRVILGLPQLALKNLKWDKLLDDQMQQMIEGVISVPAVKMVFAYDSPWWKSAGNGPVFDTIREGGIDLKLIVTDLPVRQIYDVGFDNSTNRSVLVVSYSDWWPAIHYWRHHIEGLKDPAVKAKGGHYKVSDELLSQVNTHFSQIFNISINDIPNPVFSSAYAWHNSPYWGGWHVWAPGYNYDDLQSDMLKPVKDSNIYVVGEAFSFAKGWVEGALETANATLEKYKEDFVN